MEGGREGGKEGGKVEDVLGGRLVRLLQVLELGPFFATLVTDVHLEEGREGGREG